jgi:hypothetical protein
MFTFHLEQVVFELFGSFLELAESDNSNAQIRHTYNNPCSSYVWVGF